MNDAIVAHLGLKSLILKIKYNQFELFNLIFISKCIRK
jgi:hypothetical protein